VDLKWDGKSVAGVIHTVTPQRPDVTIRNSTFDPGTGVLHLEAEVAGLRGPPPLRHVVEGKLNAGSIGGSWVSGTTKGEFKLTKTTATPVPGTNRPR
jgi:hypothetical protein